MVGIPQGAATYRPTPRPLPRPGPSIVIPLCTPRSSSRRQGTRLKFIPSPSSGDPR